MRSNKSLTNLETRLSPGNIRRGNQNKPWRPRFRFGRQHTRKLLIHCPRLSAKLFSAEWMRWERLDSFPHKRLRGRPECKLRVGDYRVLYELDPAQGRIHLHYVGHRRDIYK